MADRREKVGSVEDLFLKTSLYQEVAVNNRSGIVMAIATYDKAVDMYCVGCKQHATFRGEVSKDAANRAKLATAAMPISSRNHSYYDPWNTRLVHKTLVCTRLGHRFDYYFVCEGDFIVKVGQYPSLADIEKGDTDKYESVLGRERLKELNRAIGLAAHGVGIGAQVYLRRLFEWLVEEARVVAAKQGSGWDSAAYEKARMAERVGLLKGYLPEFLARNSRLYAILSRGIHELTEQECLKNFDALKLAIEVILEEKLKEKSVRDNAEAARKALAKIDGGGNPKTAQPT